MLSAEMLGPLVNVGAVGVCLVTLAAYYVRKDRKYESRIDERFDQEREFRKEITELSEKYRLALERFGQTLDRVVQVIPKKDGR